MLLLKLQVSSLQFGKTVMICNIRHKYKNLAGVCENEGIPSGMQVTDVSGQGIYFVMGQFENTQLGLKLGHLQIKGGY